MERYSANIVTDAGGIFGNGTSNKYLDTNDGSGNSTNVVDSTVSGAVNSGTLSFKFHEITQASRNDNFVINFGTGEPSGSRGLDFRFSDGTLTAMAGTNATAVGAYSLDTTYTADLVFNNTGSVINYFDGNSVANDTFDVWLTTLSGASMLLLDDAPFRNTLGNSNFDYLNFRTFSNDQQRFFTDDVVLRDDVFVTNVPEPSVGLLSLLGLAVVLRRKR